MSAAKTPEELPMAIRSDLMLSPVFVAPREVPSKRRAIKTRDLSRKARFSVQASHTLSEKLPTGNSCLKVDRLVLKPMTIAAGQEFSRRVAGTAKFPEQQSTIANVLRTTRSTLKKLI
jgi:hypothetical protein